MAWRPWDERPPASRPRPVRGGIRAHAQRGRFTQQWWADRWLEVLEALDVGGRLGRGRSYARSGQVVSIEIEKGKVGAVVQGSRPTPYDVAVAVPLLTAGQWTTVLDALSAQAGFVALLLAGEMPRDIEAVFRQVGVPLFPTSFADLRTSCTCPDTSNPCKHIAAVYYLLGEEFDRDPFLILRLRGLTRAELMERLGGPSGGAITPTRKPARDDHAAISPDPAVFWRPPSRAAEIMATVQVHGDTTARASVTRSADAPADAAPDSVLQRFGRFPFWRGRQSPQEALAAVYRVAARQAFEAFVADDVDDGDDAG